MNTFRIYADGEIFYHPSISTLSVTAAQVKEDAENIDNLTLSAPFNHPYIERIKPMATEIVCMKGERVVFSGRALDDGTDLYNTHTWTCESALAYLKDSLQEPFDYQGDISGLLSLFISRHNESVEEKKRFNLGEITVTDNNDYIHYSSADYIVTLDAINDKLVKTHGGYLRIRYENGEKILDYLSDFSEYSLQSVEFGKNLLDVKITRDHTERVTALIPYGAEIEDEESEENTAESEPDTDNTSESAARKRVDITSVNDDKLYICDEDAIAEIGWIWKTIVWDDVTDAYNLLRKAEARLAELKSGIVSMELTIIDESDADAETSDIHAGEYVYCRSEPHGIDGKYLCLSKTTDFLNPANNSLSIGASDVNLTSSSAKQSRNLTELENEITGYAEEIEKIPTLTGDVSALTESIHECHSEISKSAGDISLMVSEKYISKSELEEIQKDFQTSITQGSSEIRMDFTQITNEIKNTNAENKALLEEYIRFKGALIELGKIGNIFTAELSNEDLSFKQNGQRIAYISNQQLVITNAEIRNKLSLGNAVRGWFDFIPRSTGNLSVKWKDPV